MKRITILTLLASLSGQGFGARILAILPYPGKSHHIFHSAVLNTLARAGHHIVEYSPIPPKQPTKNYTHIEIHNSYGTFLKKLNYREILEEKNKLSYFGLAALDTWKFIYNITEETFENKKIQMLLQSKEHFDLVITTPNFGQEAMLVFSHKFSAPAVSLQASLYSCFLNREAGNTLSIATIPDAWSFAFSDQMTFTERLRNFISVMVTLFFYYNSHLPRQDALVKKYYKHPNVPYLGELVTNVSLTLLNTHSTVQYPRPNPPNIIPIGGIVISPDREEFSQELKMFMDDAKEGVIYFSFGTVVPAYTIPKEVLQVFVNVFQRFSQKVLWKVELNEFEGLPKNIKMVKWAPQLNVLKHPNCKVFVTHGGQFGQQEAIYAGVPTVGIPFFLDQKFNIRFNEHHGIGVSLEYEDLSEESFFWALNKVLSDPRYTENAHHLSQIFRDQPMSPAEQVVWWVEYVIRHRGAKHLHPTAATLSWHSLFLVDLCALIFAVPILLYKLLAVVVHSCKKWNTVTKSKKQN